MMNNTGDYNKTSHNEDDSFASLMFNQSSMGASSNEVKNTGDTANFRQSDKFNAAAVAQNSELFPYSPSNPKIA